MDMALEMEVDNDNDAEKSVASPCSTESNNCMASSVQLEAKNGVMHGINSPARANEHGIQNFSELTSNDDDRTLTTRCTSRRRKCKNNVTASASPAFLRKSTRARSFSRCKKTCAKDMSQLKKRKCCSTTVKKPLEHTKAKHQTPDGTSAEDCINYTDVTSCEEFPTGDCCIIVHSNVFRKFTKVMEETNLDCSGLLDQLLNLYNCDMGDIQTDNSDKLLITSQRKWVKKVTSRTRKKLNLTQKVSQEDTKVRKQESQNNHDNQQSCYRKNIEKLCGSSTKERDSDPKDLADQLAVTSALDRPVLGHAGNNALGHSETDDDICGNINDNDRENSSNGGKNFERENILFNLTKQTIFAADSDVDALNDNICGMFSQCNTDQSRKSQEGATNVLLDLDKIKKYSTVSVNTIKEKTGDEEHESDDGRCTPDGTAVDMKARMECVDTAEVKETKAKMPSIMEDLYTKDGNHFKCLICDYGTTKSHFIKKHLRVHTGERPYKCDDCEATFKQQQHLLVHKMIHTGAKPFQCIVCKKGFRRHEKLKKHHQTHCKPEEQAEIERNSVKERPTKPQKYLSCDKCKYRTLYQSDLLKHKRIHTGEKCYKCEFCDFATVWQKNLKDHRLRHTGEKPYLCAQCDYRTHDRKALRNHKVIHCPESALICEICGAKFSQQKYLNQHQVIHTGEKPFKCDSCDYKTGHKSNLRAHQLIHMPNKLFICDQCGRRFRQKGHLNSHQKLMHGDPNKIYACDLCDYQADNSQSLNSHKRKHKDKFDKDERTVNQEPPCDLQREVTSLGIGPVEMPVQGISMSANAAPSIGNLGGTPVMPTQQRNDAMFAFPNPIFQYENMAAVMNMIHDFSCQTNQHSFGNFQQ